MHRGTFIPCWVSVENPFFIAPLQGLICRLNEAKIMHIAIAGNIGSGKTTLTTLLAKHYRYEPHFEQVDDNPYLNDFYKDMQRWSFNLQVFFLRSRFAQLAELQESGKKVIQDRTIYEDAHIFAPNLHSMGLMSSRDFKNYQDLFELMEKLEKSKKACV